MASTSFFNHMSAALLGSALALTAVPAAAQPSAQDVTLAETLFRDGKRLMNEKRYSEACPKLAESQRLDPAGGTLLNLAVCYDHGGLTASAWTTYSEALVFAQRENRADRIETIQQRLQALEPRLSRVTVEVSEPSDDLMVELDGSPVRRPAWGVAMPINPGRHRLRATAPGFDEFTSEIDVPAEKTELSVTVPALARSKTGTSGAATPPPETATAAATSSTDPGRGQRTTGLVLGGVGLALVGVGSYFGVQALQQMSESDDHCPNDRCTAYGAERSSDANTSANVANVSIGVGLVTIGVGAYFFVKGRREAPENVARRPLVVPLVSRDTGGLLFRAPL